MYSANYAIYLIASTIFVVVATNGEPLKCYSCSSDSSEICATLNFRNNSRELPVEICSAEITSCFTKVSNGTTDRGCKTPSVECPNGVGDNSDQCLACDSDNCNGNVYPEYRLHCLHCAGEDCVQPSNAVTVRYPCANYVENDSCYTIFSYDGQLAYRGCTSDNETIEGSQFCRQNAAQCEKCASRGCNNAEVKWEKTLSCVVCNSTEDANCKDSNGAEHDMCVKTVAGYENHCFTRIGNHSVERGCLLGGATLDTFNDCNAWYSKTCAICTGDFCNAKSIANEYCYDCTTSDDSNCTDNADIYMSKSCQMNLVENGCYRISEDENDELIRRGCASELNETEVIKCHTDQQRYCKLCTGNDCNRKLKPQTCYICSSANEANCMANATALMSTECANYVDQCIILIDSMNNDAIVRNCLRNVYKDDTFCRNNPSMCNVCEEDNCNTQPLADNQTCYACDSAIDSNCHGNLTDAMITKCSPSVNNLGCYHFGSEAELSVRRGCLSDLSSIEYAKCEANKTDCKTCKGSNCNNRNSFQQCYACNSTEDVNCIRAVSSFDPVTCRAYNDECYIHVANDVVTRGCLRESSNVYVETECKDRDICQKCAGEVGCNNKTIDGEFCMTCDSDVNPDCRTNLTIAMRTQCSLAVSPMGCYRFEDEGNGGEIVKRGCVSNIRPDEREMCRRQGDNCKTCFGDDCNTRITFQRCYVCNSTESVNCIRVPSIFPVAMCRDYLDTCFTRVMNDIVDRGCLRQTAASNDELIEDCSNNEVCATCNEKDRCNNKVIEGEFCLTCDSNLDTNCRSNVSYAMRTQCALAVTTIGCYRFEDEHDLVKRGCVSDVRPDDREMCRNQTDLCKTCLGNDCNEKISFQKCHVCNSTSSVNCIRAPNAFPAPICRDYLDKCFTHVRNDIVVRGCARQSTEEQVNLDCGKIVNADYCDLCMDGRCNNRIVDGEFCLTCDSSFDTNCRTNLTTDMRKQCALAVNPMGCYRSENKDDLVKRGCLANVDADKRQMCRTEGRSCKTCVGNDCNAKTTFQQCVTCRSAGNDTLCETNAASFDNQMCKYYLDDCFTHVRNNITTRGCLLEQQNDLVGVDFAKDCADPDICQKCDETDRCNVSPVVFETCGRQDGPQLPFRLAQCPKAVTALGCFRDVNKFTGEATRGCVSQLSPSKRRLCREEGDTCKTCTSNSSTAGVCNTIDSFTKCYSCDSTSNPNCAATPTDGMVVTCGIYNDTCFTSLNATNGLVRRGCLGKMSPQFINLCKANEQHCNICVDGQSACNNRSVGIERCIECDSNVDPNCIDGLHLFGDGKVCNAKQPLNWQGCYLRMENKLVRRGCVSDIADPVAKESCINGTSNCKVCNGQNCNRKATFQTCYDCDSRTFEQCSQLNSSSTVVCRKYLDTCLTTLSNDSHMRRGCSEQFTPADLANNSQILRCPSSNCNGQIYPADRQLCHRCSGHDNCQYLQNADNSSTLHACPLYAKNDECFSLLRNHNRMYRGCKSDRSVAQNECQLHPAWCKQCKGNGCNTHDRTTKPTLTCLYCNRTIECLYGQMPSSSIVQPCHNHVLFNQHESCFIHRSARGVSRGCTLDIEGDDRWCSSNGNCTQCPDNKCNRENAFAQRCYQCSGPDCVQISNESTAIDCPGIFGRPRAGCYTNFKATTNVTRGCFNDLSDLEVHKCHTSNQCLWCLANNCNNQKAAALMTKISPVLVVLSVIFAQMMTK